MGAKGMAIWSYRVLPPRVGVREGEEPLLAAINWQRCGERVEMSWVVVSYKRMAGMREEDALMRVTESCHGVEEMRVEGGADASCRELPDGGRKGRKGRNGCEPSWAAERWQR